MALAPVTKRSASDQVYEQLLAEVLTGRLSPGDPLPPERSLTQTLDVNRQAVREALQRLAQAGLIKISQGESTRVLDYRHSASLDLLARLLFDPNGEADVAVARSILEMRLSIGADVARLAANRALETHHVGLARVVQEMAGTQDLKVLAELDLGFWDILVDAADNVAYRLAFNSLRATYEPLAETLSPILADELSDNAEHITIVRAIKKGNASVAESAARRLLSKGAAAMQELFASVDRKAR